MDIAALPPPPPPPPPRQPGRVSQYVRAHPRLTAGALIAVAFLGVLVGVLLATRPGSPPVARPTPTPFPTSSATPITASTTVTCVNDPTADTAALLAAIAATPSGGGMKINAGTCALDKHLPIRKSIAIQGAGQTATFLVQHAAVNIFQITVPGVTVSDMNLDSATFNPGPPIKKAPKPGVLFSDRSNTTIRNVTASAGTGFAIRITGPSPCSSYQTSGTVVDNVTVTNQGRGGFTALDIDCTNGAQLTNITIHGDYIAFFQDENVTLNGEKYTPDAIPCQAPWYITGPASNIAISNVTGGGHGITKGPNTGISAVNQVTAPGC